ncbi:flagellar basal-body MS-ring/collar protein FliF [Magnetospirillum gryphiswaldense]|uniref:flagellar basal-body MS-ring/collar protein FliF n=1 Tax=Magnetospirillum gryphiswaldense TaxID=55518 RepID=UPI0018F89B34|nr:flagellar basal-body MS-ring/collar protein FliF [Magnetospirillum gryphiswaldense]
MNAFMQMMRGLGPMRLAAIAGVGVSILGFFIYLMSRVAAPQMELLYGDLEMGDSKAIVEKLAADKIPFEVRKDGAEIWVSKDKKNELRVRMAEQAMPSVGRVAGYELFDKQDALSSTSFQQNINYVRALEGELSRTIRAIDKVKVARVHLVLPKREAFAREANEPSASVILKMQGAARLDKAQVTAIQHLIAAAVPKMKPNRISIVDDKGTLLAKGYDNDQEVASENAEALKMSTENRLARTVESMLERSLGPGRVRAEVSVEMDLSRAVTTEETYDPESQVVRSQVTVNENEENQDGETPNVSVTNNLPDPNASAASGNKSSSKAAKTQETVNYEISKKVKNTVREMGEVRRITAAVLVDGVYDVAADGKKTYRDRSPEETAKLEELVRNAIGFDRSRQDQVKVVSMQFAGGEEQYAAEEPGEFIFGMRRDFVEKIASNLGLSIVAILFLLLVLRPLIGRAIESMQGQVGPDGRRLLTADGSGVPQLAGPGAPAVPAPALGGEEEVIADELIDIDKVEGRVKASSIRKIGEIVDKHPEEALSIIRNWLYQEA